MIGATGISLDASVIDIGAGTSPLASRLIGQGFTQIAVLDISATAIAEARQRVSPDAPVEWLVADVLSWRPARRYDVWHDRAVFHFLVSAAERDEYRRTLSSALVPGGFVVIGTFATDGPESCSGLPVAGYSETGLAAELGDGFTVVARRREEHHTPSGLIQPFTWICLKFS